MMMVGLMEEALSTQFLLVGLLTIVLSWWITYKWKRREIDRLGALIPGPPTVPIIGNTFDWVGEPKGKTFRTIIYHLDLQKY
jgi:hypothetical protein